MIGALHKDLSDGVHFELGQGSCPLEEPVQQGYTALCCTEL